MPESVARRFLHFELPDRVRRVNPNGIHEIYVCTASATTWRRQSIVDLSAARHSHLACDGMQMPGMPDITPPGVQHAEPRDKESEAA